MTKINTQDDFETFVLNSKLIQSVIGPVTKEKILESREGGSYNSIILNALFISFLGGITSLV